MIGLAEGYAAWMVSAVDDPRFEKEVTEVTYICVLDGTDFNFTNNFTVLSGSGRQMYSVDTGVINSHNTSVTSSAFTGSAGQPSSYIYFIFFTQCTNLLEFEKQK